MFNTMSKWAPALEEMQAFAKQYLKEHPEHGRSRLQKLMDEHGYRLIFTPPYTPQLQPIELL
jgi:transposase